MALLMGYKEYTSPWDIKNTPQQGGNPRKGIFLLISPNMCSQKMTGGILI